MSTFKGLAKQTKYKFSGADETLLETFETPEGLNPSLITLTQKEHTSLCPVTGQPDYGTVEVIYKPRLVCLESKSFKLYLMSFRDMGHFCEETAAKVKRDLIQVLKPHSLVVRVTYVSRGGVTLQAEARYDKN
jgi:7-cyano-7-deazaguanine reductase